MITRAQGTTLHNVGTGGPDHTATALRHVWDALQIWDHRSRPSLDTLMVADFPSPQNTSGGDADARPALLGGQPVRPEGPPSWPLRDPDILDALRRAHADGSWGKYHGPWCDQLQDRLIAYHGVAFASLCCSGTFAVELALRSLRVGSGDEVVMAGYDFSGNFHSILATGAIPVLVDVEPHNSNLGPQQLEAAIGPKTRVVIATHLHGAFVPMPAVCEVAARHGLKVVEDAAQMPGAVIHGRKAGTWGDMGVLSFGGSKLLSAGRGGALLTRHADLNHRAKLFCNRGNHAFPLSELQAAVLLPQLAKLDERNARRAKNVRYLLGTLAGVKGLKPLTPSPLVKEAPGGDKPTASPIVGDGRGGGHCDADSQPGFYKLGFQYNPAAFDHLPRERFVAMMRAEGIAFDAGFRSLAGRSPSRCRKVGPLTHVRRAGDRMVVLHHPVLLGNHRDMDQVAAAVHRIAAYRQ
jgi:perosamine synthetase